MRKSADRTPWYCVPCTRVPTPPLSDHVSSDAEPDNPYATSSSGDEDDVSSDADPDEPNAMSSSGDEDDDQGAIGRRPIADVNRPVIRRVATPDQDLGDRPLDDNFPVDQEELTYEIVEKGTQRGNRKLVSSDGCTYTYKVLHLSLLNVITDDIIHFIFSS